MKVWLCLGTKPLDLDHENCTKSYATRYFCLLKCVRSGDNRFLIVVAKTHDRLRVAPTHRLQSQERKRSLLTTTTTDEQLREVNKKSNMLVFLLGRCEASVVIHYDTLRTIKS